MLAESRKCEEPGSEIETDCSERVIATVTRQGLDFAMDACEVHLTAAVAAGFIPTMTKCAWCSLWVSLADDGLTVAEHGNGLWEIDEHGYPYNLQGSCYGSRHPRPDLDPELKEVA